MSMSESVSEMILDTSLILFTLTKFQFIVSSTLKQHLRIYIMDIYQENGYKSREDYLKGLAEEMGMDESFVFMAADLMGLVTMLEDYSAGL